MFKQKIKLGVLLLLIAFSTSACLQVNTSRQQKTLPDAGLYVSLHKGDAWQQRTAILSTKGSKNFSLDQVASMAFDPSDEEAIYFGTIGNGMLYSYDQGNSWQIALELGPGTVNAIAIDPNNSCLVYASKGNKLFKSIDCNRHWEVIFTDDDVSAIIKTIAIDHFNTHNIYLALARGDIVKSNNTGDSWQTVYRFKKRVNKLVIDANDSRIMYVDVNTLGLHKTTDGGKNWQNISDILTNFKIGKQIVDIHLIKGQPNLLFIATTEGIIKSEDSGHKWQQLSLLSPKRRAQINSLAINPQNIKEIYYVSNKTFYQSIDGGENWITRVIPSSRQAKILLLNPQNPNILYLGIANK